MSHKKSGDCFTGSCEICNPPRQYITNDWKKKAEALQAQLANFTVNYSKSAIDLEKENFALKAQIKRYEESMYQCIALAGFYKRARLMAEVLEKALEGEA